MAAFHVTLCVPPAIPPPDFDAIRHALDDLGFRAHLQHAVRAVIRPWPALEKLRVFVTQLVCIRPSPCGLAPPSRPRLQGIPRRVKER
jgi:hypothetical protein